MDLPTNCRASSRVIPALSFRVAPSFRPPRSNTAGETEHGLVLDSNHHGRWGKSGLGGDMQASAGHTGRSPQAHGRDADRLPVFGLIGVLGG